MAQDAPIRKAIPADFNSYMDAYIAGCVFKAVAGCGARDEFWS